MAMAMWFLVGAMVGTGAGILLMAMMVMSKDDRDE
jgi:hypothetical protein